MKYLCTSLMVLIFTVAGILQKSKAVMGKITWTGERE